MNVGKLSKFFCIAVLAILITGCPRIAYVELYNNSGVDLKVNVSGIEHPLIYGHSIKVEYPGETIQLTSELGKWAYTRNIPHNGEDGPFFNGTLKLQVNASGQVYALRITDSAPIKNYSDQPSGYPLEVSGFE